MSFKYTITERPHTSWVRELKPPLLVYTPEAPQSHPSWVRELKRNLPQSGYAQILVAPLVGARIETTQAGVKISALSLSHPSWVRELKLPLLHHQQMAVLSHPSWVRELKQSRLISYHLIT